MVGRRVLSFTARAAIDPVARCWASFALALTRSDDDWDAELPRILLDYASRGGAPTPGAIAELSETLLKRCKWSSADSAIRILRTALTTLSANWVLATGTRALPREAVQAVDDTSLDPASRIRAAINALRATESTSEAELKTMAARLDAPVPGLEIKQEDGFVVIGSVRIPIRRG